MQVAEEPFVRPALDAADLAEAVLIVAGRGGMALGMIDVDLGVFVERGGRFERLGEVGAAVAGFESQDFDAAKDARVAIDAHGNAAGVAEFLEEFGHGGVPF